MDAIAQKTIDLVKSAINNSPTGVTFFSLNRYENKNGEVANHIVNVGFSYTNAVKKDIETLKNLNVKTLKTNINKTILEEARQALLVALINPNKARSQAQKDAFTHITNGVKVCNSDGALHIYALRIKKNILVSGEYKPVNSKPLTLAKNFIRKNCLKTGQFVNFKMIPKQAETISGGTETIIIK